MKLYLRIPYFDSQPCWVDFVSTSPSWIHFRRLGRWTPATRQRLLSDQAAAKWWHLLSDQATSAEAIQDTVEILNGLHEPWWPTEQIYPAILCLPWKDGQARSLMSVLIVFFHGTQNPVVCRCFSFSKEYFQVPHWFSRVLGIYFCLFLRVSTHSIMQI